MSTPDSSSTHDRVEGKAKEMAGATKEAIGHAVGSEEMEADGARLKSDGQFEAKVGDVKKVFGK